MRLTLTSDDGPNLEGTSAVLEASADGPIPGVFFVIGHKVRSHPELVARASTNDHLIENHAWSRSVTHTNFVLSKLKEQS